MSTAQGPQPPTEHTIAANAGVRFALDPADFERASRGLLAQIPGGRIEGPYGTAWDIGRYDFIRPDAPPPPSVNPSLWRQSQLNVIHGLFEVAPGLWQSRGYDISNVSFIAGKEGWVVVDPLTSAACARASLALANRQLGERPVTAVIYTHSHTDHFGGVLGVTTPEDVAAGRCQVIAPEHFMLETVAENLLAGPAMARRAAYQFGPLLPPGPLGHVDAGLGKAIPIEAPGLIAPTHDITFTGEELVVDGVRIVFQLTPQTEAPAEMQFFFPDHRWLCTAEICTHTMHNLVPIRGAQVRDALSWSKYINEAIELFGARTETMFASHHWPRWGGADIRSYLERQRDLYRWMHDQTLRMANQGWTAPEIANRLELPEEFLADGSTRGYYGDLVHNSKAVYQRYLSWYDGNPARLNTHPPVEAGRRYVDFMGGADAVLAKARASFDAGDYRWVAEVVNHLVFADPSNTAARELQARALEQLGYQAESSTFRNAYLMGAQELRQGPPAARATMRRGLIEALAVEQAFDVIAVRLKSEAVGGQRLLINWRFTDLGTAPGEDWVLILSNRALSSVKGRHDPAAAATVTLTKATFVDCITGGSTFVDQVLAGNVVIDGDADALRNVLGNLDTVMGGFAIVEP
jgi:alkyl sulfatase BDS1-like metallo-beta-lactamase superfamily hydrolase